MDTDPMLDAKEKYHLNQENGHIEKSTSGYIWVKEKSKKTIDI